MKHWLVYIPLALHEQRRLLRLRWRCVRCGDRFRFYPDRYDRCPA